MKGQWKPRHVVAIVVALAAAVVLAPVAVGAATGQLVNIADGTNSAHLAKVDSGGKILVGDGSGRLTVDGGEAAPADFVHKHWYANAGSACWTFYTPPAGKALVVKTLVVDVYDNPTPGTGNYVELDLDNGGGGCPTIGTRLNPAANGVLTVPFEPGLAVPNGMSLATYAQGNVKAEIDVYGYLVSASAVPTSSAPSTPAAPAGAGQGGPAAGR